MGKVAELKSAILQLREIEVSSDSFDTESENLPELLSKVAAQPTFEFASFPRKLYAAVVVGGRKQAAVSKFTERAQTTSPSNQTSKRAKPKRIVKNVHLNVRANISKCYQKSKLSLHRKSKTVHMPKPAKNKCDIVLSNKFSVLYCDDVNEDDDHSDDHTRSKVQR